MRRATGLVGFVAIAITMVLSGCALPQDKDEAAPAKQAMRVLSAQPVLNHYNQVRASVDAGVDPDPLVEIEGRSLLEIDSAAVYLRKKLAREVSAVTLAPTRDIESAEFDGYPLWFLARTALPGYDESVMAIFERRSSTDRWLLVEAPRLDPETAVSAAAAADDGGVVIYDAVRDVWSDGEESGLRQTPQELANDYSKVLTDPGSQRSDDFIDDSFRMHMRELAQSQPDRRVTFDQRWHALPVRHSMRLADGNALVFATLARRDRYRVQRGHSLDFTGVDAAAYFSAPIKRQATLRYVHQVVMLVPSAGKPLVIGQYGGLVAASGS